MELSDRELAIRWWGRKSNQEKIEAIKLAKLTDLEIDNISRDSIVYIWRNQPYN